MSCAANAMTLRLGIRYAITFFQPETRVTDERTGHKTGDIQRVMNGEFDDFIDNYLRWQQAQKAQEA